MGFNVNSKLISNCYFFFSSGKLKAPRKKIFRTNFSNRKYAPYSEPILFFFSRDTIPFMTVPILLLPYKLIINYKQTLNLSLICRRFGYVFFFIYGFYLFRINTLGFNYYTFEREYILINRRRLMVLNLILILIL